MRTGLTHLLAMAALCATAGTTAAQDAEVFNELAGEWRYTHSPSGCVETMTFNEDGTFEGGGAEEVYGGTYVLAAGESDSGRQQLDLEITHDNGLADCQNNSWNDAGMSRTLYVAFRAGDSLVFYEYDDGGEPLARFTRVLAEAE